MSKALEEVTSLTGSTNSSQDSLPPPPKKRPQLPPLSLSTSKSPTVSVHVAYKNPRNYTLTPIRKHLGKAIARGSKQSVAKECLKDPVTKKYLMKRIGMLVRNELILMCSDSTNSILRQQFSSAYKEFSWEKLIQELESNAPMFLSILQECTRTRRPRPNRNVVLGMCAALLLKLRFSKMSLVQKVLSLVLYGGNSGKMVYERLQRVNVTMSHKSTIRLLTDVGTDHDEKVKKWQCLLTDQLSVSPEQGEFQSSSKKLPVIVMTSDSENDDSLVFGSDECDIISSSTDISDPMYSSLSDLSEVETCSSPGIDEESCAENDVSSLDHDSVMEISGSTSKTPASFPLSFKIVGDNLDKSVKARYMRLGGRRNQSLHYFHSFAVLDRIDFSGLPDVHPQRCLNSPSKRALSLLPSSMDDKALNGLFATHVSRILATHMPFFKLAFEDIVEWHIQHDYYSEMSAKSEVVPLGVLNKNENKGDEMVEIMYHLMGYVPAVKYTKRISIPEREGETFVSECASLHKILFGGDQLTAARARGALRTRGNSFSPVFRLEGLIPCAEDWHTQLNLLGLIWKYFYSKSSAGEHGTLYQLRNLIRRTNVVSDPTNNFNSCSDFLHLVTTCQILTASLEVLGMKSLSDTPSSPIIPTRDDLLAESPARRKEVLTNVSNTIVERFIKFQFNTGTKGDLASASKPKAHTRSSKPTPSDGVHDYAMNLMGMGCLYMEYADAIREGDGHRVVRCWKYLMPVFRYSERKNYALEAFTLLNQYEYQLTPRQSAQLAWNRFINTHGTRGRNIPCDLHQEHLNKICKRAIRNLGPNQTETAITRAGKVLGTLYPVLVQYDMQTHVPDENNGNHRAPTSQKDRDTIIHELQRSKVFTIIPNREYSTFPKPRDPLHAKSQDELIEWITKHIASIDKKKS